MQSLRFQVASYLPNIGLWPDGGSDDDDDDWRRSPSPSKETRDFEHLCLAEALAHDEMTIEVKVVIAESRIGSRAAQDTFGTVRYEAGFADRCYVTMRIGLGINGEAYVKTPNNLVWFTSISSNSRFYEMLAILLGRRPTHVRKPCIVYFCSNSLSFGDIFEERGQCTFYR